MIRRPPRSPLFPYTPLSRSGVEEVVESPDPTPPLVVQLKAVHVRVGQRGAGVDTQIDAKLRGVVRRERRGDGQEGRRDRSEEHTSELQSPCNLVCRLLLEKK